MADDDPADNEAMIFTEADVFLICGYLSSLWGVDYSTEDVEEAIQTVLSSYD